MLTGFKREITEKLSGFTAHLTIVPFDTQLPREAGVIRESGPLIQGVGQIEGVSTVYGFVDKPAIAKSAQEIHGVLLKGYDRRYHPRFFTDHLTAGVWPDFSVDSTAVVLSESTARLLQVGIGDRVDLHFVQEPPRVRPCRVRAVYNTGFKEYDDLVAIVDIRLLQRINGWGEQGVTALAVEVGRLSDLPAVQSEVNLFLLKAGHDMQVQTLYDMAPQIFDWLQLINMNVWVILILIVLVAGFNMVSGLLILILDKTQLIGLMKTLGARDVSLRKLFLYVSLGLILRGMFWGNLLALLLGGIQYRWHLISLDAASYYMDRVPIHFDIPGMIAVNAGVVVVTLLMLLVPTLLIARIDPIKTIQFD